MSEEPPNKAMLVNLTRAQFKTFFQNYILGKWEKERKTDTPIADVKVVETFATYGGRRISFSKLADEVCFLFKGSNGNIVHVSFCATLAPHAGYVLIDNRIYVWYGCVFEVARLWARGDKEGAFELIEKNKLIKAEVEND